MRGLQRALRRLLARWTPLNAFQKTVSIESVCGWFQHGSFSLDLPLPDALRSNHTGFDGCDSVESDSPMYIPLRRAGVRKTAHLRVGFLRFGQGPPDSPPQPFRRPRLRWEGSIKVDLCYYPNSAAARGATPRNNLA